MVALATVLSWSGSSRAQPPVPQRRSSVAFADFAPESTGLLIGAMRLADLDAALDRARAWQFLAILMGGSVEIPTSVNLSKILASILGLRGISDPGTLAKSEVGVAMPHSMDLGSAVWFVRVSDPGLLDRWFPPADRLEAGSSGAVRHFRMRNGSKVAISGPILAISRRWEPGSFFDKTLSVMSGRDTSLARFSAFRSLSTYLPGNYLAVTYLAGAPTEDDDVAPPLSWWPAARHVMVGLFEREGRFDVAIRASLRGRGSTAKLSRMTIDRLLRLPQTTLVSAATTVDIAHLRRARSAARPPSMLERYLGFLGGLQDPVAAGQGEPQLGPNVLMAWGQDLRAGGSAPQVALLVECSAGKAVRRRTRHMVEGLLRFVRLLEPKPFDATLRIVHSRYLGATIYSVPLSAYADKSGLKFMPILRDASPSWTVWNGWLIFAASRDHLERILDAQYGLIPGLGTVDDVRGLRLSKSDRSAVSIVQPDLATKVLDGWLATHNAGGETFLNSSWWGGQTQVAADNSVVGRRIDPIGAIRELAEIGRTLEFASYAVDISDANHFSARISLRFRARRDGKANAK